MVTGCVCDAFGCSTTIFLPIDLLAVTGDSVGNSVLDDIASMGDMVMETKLLASPTVVVALRSDTYIVVSVVWRVGSNEEGLS